MNVASLELSKELYELSGWDDTNLWHADDPEADTSIGFAAMAEPNEHEVYASIPAYDLGYLLRKLEGLDVGIYYTNTWRSWVATAHDNQQGKADTPEDAACKLSIELFKQGVLWLEDNNKENNNG